MRVQELLAWVEFKLRDKRRDLSCASLGHADPYPKPGESETQYDVRVWNDHRTGNAHTS